MKKIVDNYLLRILSRAFLSSTCQFIFFKVILTIYLIWLPWPPVWWSVLVAEFLLPLIGGYVCCHIMHWKHFRFSLRNAHPKRSIYRLVGRVSAVLFYLVIGIAMEVLRSANPELPINFLLKLGISSDIVFTVLFNFFSYFITAIFPITYAIVEFLFVSPADKGTVLPRHNQPF